MKPLLLILALATVAAAQELQWKPIREMSGEIPNHPGVTVEFSAAEIARRDDGVKLILRAEFPWGAPSDLIKVPASELDVTSLFRFTGRMDFNCRTLVVKPDGGGEAMQFNGKKHKTKESPFSIPQSHILSQYFCERGSAPTEAPTLKPK
jgi:hypothetical protein